MPERGEHVTIEKTWKCARIKTFAAVNQLSQVTVVHTYFPVVQHVLDIYIYTHTTYIYMYLCVHV